MIRRGLAVARQRGAGRWAAMTMAMVAGEPTCCLSCGGYRNGRGPASWTAPSAGTVVAGRVRLPDRTEITGDTTIAARAVGRPRSQRPITKSTTSVTTSASPSSRR